VEIQRYVDARAYLARVQPVLEKDEVTNNLPLGLLLRLAAEPEHRADEGRPFFALAEDEGEVPFGMMMTPPHNMILFGEGESLDAAVEAAVAFLLCEGVRPPGAIGPREIAARFASAWGRQTGRPVAVRMEQMIYRLNRVNEVALSPGELVPATEGHVDLVTGWMVAFAEVAGEVLRGCLESPTPILRHVVLSA
jgi:hypothetical protein